MQFLAIKLEGADFPVMTVSNLDPVGQGIRVILTKHTGTKFAGISTA